MSKKHLSLKPHNIDKNTWWYEDNGGIDVVVHRDAFIGNTLGSIIKRISWRQLRGALKRKDEKD